MNFKSIDLAETIDKDTLVYEKIAPGTSGSFNILLDSALKCNTFKHFISSFQLKQFHISIINLIFIL